MNRETQNSYNFTENMMVSNIKQEVLDEEEPQSEMNPVDHNLELLNHCDETVIKERESHILKIKTEPAEEGIIADLSQTNHEENPGESGECLQLEDRDIKKEINPDNESQSSLEKKDDNDSCDIEYADIKKEYTCDTLETNKELLKHLQSPSKYKTKKFKTSEDQNDRQTVDVKVKQFVDGGLQVNNYKCPICYIEYPCLETFKLHIEYHGTMNLTNLSAGNSNIVSYFNTTTVENNKSKKIHCCDMCNYASTHLNNLRTHKRTHSGERPFACKDCDYTSSQLVHLKSHQLIHLGLKPFACDECEHTCRDLSHLKAHKLLHTGVKPFACVDCDFTCRVASQLRVHRRIHTGEKPFPCDECDFVGDYAHSLKEHKQIHTGEKPFACDKCGYATRWLRHLKTHQRVHTGEKPYKCDECTYTSSQKSHLITHKRTHSGEKPYACDKCSYTSSQLTHIREHKRRHSNEKPYGCEKCSYTTRTSQELRRHKMSKGHGGLPPQPRGKVKKEPA